MATRFASDVSVELVEVSPREGRRMLNAQTQDKLGIGAAEFLKRLDADEYLDSEDETVLRLVMLAPFAR